MSGQELALLQRLVDLQAEAVRLQKAALMPQLRRSAAEILTKTAQRRAFEAFNGRRTLREVQAEVSVPVSTLGRWANGWRQSGLVFDNAEGRVEHLMSLDGLGLAAEAEN